MTMNIDLKKTGYYREMPHADETDPSIKDFIGAKIDEKTKEQICQYLNSGSVLIACYGLVADVLNPEEGIAGCPSMLTDGVWVWPGDLSYYVAKYSLCLNDDFIETMHNNNWIVDPCNVEKLDYDNLMIDGRKLID